MSVIFNLDICFDYIRIDEAVLLSPYDVKTITGSINVGVTLKSGRRYDILRCI